MTNEEAIEELERFLLFGNSRKLSDEAINLATDALRKIERLQKVNDKLMWLARENGIRGWDYGRLCEHLEED